MFKQLGYMTKTVMCILFLGFSFAASAAQPNITPAGTLVQWKHPGVVVSKAQLDFIKTQYDNKVAPWYRTDGKVENGLVANAEKSNYGQTDGKYGEILGPYAGGINQCGSHSGPDHGCSHADKDTASAYVQALLWYITENQAYYDHVVKILNTYGNVKNGLKGFYFTFDTKSSNSKDGRTPTIQSKYPCPGDVKTCSNAPLQAAWDAEKFTRAAEIIRYGHPDLTASYGKSAWQTDDIKAFSNMLNNVYKPLIYDGSNNNGNWELSMVDAMMGIAVFNEDADLLQRARTFWKIRVPAYFYNDDLDKGTPKEAYDPFSKTPTVEYHPNWNGQKTFKASTTGVTQETCRDLKHTEDSIASATDAAETDYIQGGSPCPTKDDPKKMCYLYTDPTVGAEQRLVTSLNLMAGFQLSGEKSGVSKIVAPEDFCGSKHKITLGIGTTYVIGYNEYHNRLNDSNMTESVTAATSNTYNLIQKNLYTQIYSDQGVHMAIFEALTHYANAPTTADFQVSVTPSTQTVEAGKSVSYAVKVNPTDGYNQNVTLSLAGTVPTGVSYKFNPSIVSSKDWNSTLTVSTNSDMSAGSYNLQISGTDDTLTNGTSATIDVASPLTAITIAADDQTVSQGSDAPSLTYSVSPNVPLDTAPTCTTNYQKGDAAGNDYTITCSGAVKQNYSFKYTDGTLTVTAPTATGTLTVNNSDTSDLQCLNVADTLYIDGSKTGLPFNASTGLSQTLQAGAHTITLASSSTPIPVSSGGVSGTCSGALSTKTVTIQADQTTPVTTNYSYQGSSSDFTCHITSASIIRQRSSGANKFDIDVTLDNLPQGTNLSGEIVMVNPFTQNFRGKKIDIQSTVNNNTGTFSGAARKSTFSLQGYINNDTPLSIGSNPLTSLTINGVTCK